MPSLWLKPRVSVMAPLPLQPPFQLCSTIYGVMAQVHFRAGKDNLKGVPKADLPRVKNVLKERGHLLIPIVALVFFPFSIHSCQLCRSLHHCLNCGRGELPQNLPYGLQRNIRSARRWCQNNPFRSWQPVLWWGLLLVW